MGPDAPPGPDDGTIGHDGTADVEVALEVAVERPDAPTAPRRVVRAFDMDD